VYNRPGWPAGVRTRLEITYRSVSRASREFASNESAESVIERAVSISDDEWEIRFGRGKTPFALSGNEIPPRWRRSQGSLVCVPKGDGTRQPLGDVSAIVRSWFPMVIKTGMIKTCLAPRYTPASALCAPSPIQPRVDSMQLPWRTPRRARDTITVNRGLVDLTTGLTTLSAWSRFLARKRESLLRERKGACSPPPHVCAYLFDAACISQQLAFWSACYTARRRRKPGTIFLLGVTARCIHVGNGGFRGPSSGKRNSRYLQGTTSRKRITCGCDSKREISPATD